MLTRRLLYDKLIANLRYTSARKYATQEYAKKDLSFAADPLPPLNPKGKKKHPFVKDLFLPRFDTDILAFPQIMPIERHYAFYEWLQPVQEFISEVRRSPEELSRKDILSELKRLGVFRAAVGTDHGGLGFSRMERAKLAETLADIPWVSMYVAKNHFIPTDIISKYCSEEQKAKYLPKIATGEIVPAVCLTEVGHGTNVHNMVCTAVSEPGKGWRLSGTKNFVPNAEEANLFVVFAKCIMHNVVNEKFGMFAAFLVDKDSNGVTCEEVEEMVGQDSYPLSTVNFRNVRIPEDSQINTVGSAVEMVQEFLRPGMQEIAPYSIGILKTFVNLLIKHVLHNKYLDKNMHEILFVKDIISNITGVLYSMESMLYMTAGLQDNYIDQDVSMEKAIMETYCARECVAAIQNGLQLLATHSILKKLPYARLYDSALFLPTMECNTINNKTYIALLGLKHLGNAMKLDVQKFRNPALYPKSVLMFQFKSMFMRQPKLDLYIPDNLHFSLKDCGERLERMVAELAINANAVLREHGTEVVHGHVSLQALSEIAIRVYALTAMLARASKSYCIGLRSAEYERILITNMSAITEQIVRTEKEKIKEDNIDFLTLYSMQLADDMYTAKAYRITDPLARE